MTLPTLSPDFLQGISYTLYLLTIPLGWTGWFKMLTIRHRHLRLWHQHPRLNDLLVVVAIIIALWSGLTLIYLSEGMYHLDVSHYRPWVDFGWSAMALLFIAALLMMIQVTCQALIKQNQLQRRIERHERQ
jgi:hypothetical protein